MSDFSCKHPKLATAFKKSAAVGVGVFALGSVVAAVAIPCATTIMSAFAFAVQAPTVAAHLWNEPVETYESRAAVKAALDACDSLQAMMEKSNIEGEKRYQELEETSKKLRAETDKLLMSLG